MHIMIHRKDIWTQKIHNIGTKYSAGVETQAQIDDDVDVGMLKKKRHRREVSFLVPFISYEIVALFRQ